ncbi:MAG TPA: DUF4389 domain-containing protein [Acidimicrobiales bacterium]|jgi:Domain of unknown function (DUF4389)|nr:DUF4389 domain-containing protein [Acidimicrobiales bacterium]
METFGQAYPATLEIDRAERIANWRPIVQWLLAIPHFVILYVLGIVAEVVSIISWFVILFTGKLPEGLATLMSLYIRYNNRAVAYAGFLRDEYPPFAFETVAPDPGTYPAVRTGFAPELENRNRLTVAFRIILVIPQLIVLSILGLVAFVAWVIAFFAVLFTGRWPEGLRTFVVGVMRWGTRVTAYLYLLTDEYPPFSLD